jgi:catecholate siderophore receptor
MSQSVKAFWLAGVGALALAAGSLPATPARAETDAEADVQVLEGVVVTGRREGYGVPSTTTATRTETGLKETPQSVTVVTDELIDDQAMQGMADVLRYVPGATMAQGEGHRDAPVLRGNASTADFFVDGVRDDVQYFRDLYNLDRVEVLKGPNAMIFGRGGGGGVINRVTKRAHGGPSAGAPARGRAPTPTPASPATSTCSSPLPSTAASTPSTSGRTASATRSSWSAGASIRR